VQKHLLLLYLLFSFD